MNVGIDNIKVKGSQPIATLVRLSKRDDFTAVGSGRVIYTFESDRFPTMRIWMNMNSGRLTMAGSVPQMLGGDNIDGVTDKGLLEFRVAILETLGIDIIGFEVQRLDICATLPMSLPIPVILSQALGIAGYKKCVVSKLRSNDNSFAEFERADYVEVEETEFWSSLDTKVLLYDKGTQMDEKTGKKNSFVNGPPFLLRIEVSIMKKVNDRFKQFPVHFSDLVTGEKRIPYEKYFFRWVDKIYWKEGFLPPSGESYDVADALASMLLNCPEVFGMDSLDVELWVDYLYSGTDRGHRAEVRKEVKHLHGLHVEKKFVAKEFREKLDSLR